MGYYSRMREMPLLDKLRKETDGWPTAVEGKRIFHVSPSQIESYKACARKWYQEALEGLRQPPTPSQEFGTEVHGVIESFLQSGELPQGASERAVAVSSAGQRFWPQRGKDAFLLEQEMLVHAQDDPDLPPLYGFADIIWLDGRVDDHKTTSDFKYAKSEHQLGFLPQPVIYGMHALSIGATRQEHGERGVRVRFIYYRTKGAREALAVETFLTETELRHRIKDVFRVVREMVHTVARLPLDAVPASTGACKDYGGCHLRQRCHSMGVPVAGHTVFDDLEPDLVSGNNYTNKEKEETVSDQPIPKALAGLFAGRQNFVAKIVKEETEAEAAEAAPPPQAAPKPPAAPAQPLRPPALAGVFKPQGINPPDGFPMDVPGDKGGPKPPEPQASSVQPPAPEPAAAKPKGRIGKPAKPKQAEEDAGDESSSDLPAGWEQQAVIDMSSAGEADRVENRKRDVAQAEQALTDARVAVRDANNKYAELADEDEDAAAEFKAETLVPAKNAVKKAEANLAECKQVLAKAEARLQEALAKEAAEAAAKEAAAKKAPAGEAAQAVPEIPADNTEKIAAKRKEYLEMAAQDASRAKPRIYIGCIPRGEDVIYFDEWVQQYYRRAEATRKTGYWLNMQHEAVPAVVSEILADLRSGKVVLNMSMVFPRYAAQQSAFVDALIPFYGAHNVVERVG